MLGPLGCNVQSIAVPAHILPEMSRGGTFCQLKCVFISLEKLSPNLIVYMFHTNSGYFCQICGATMSRVPGFGRDQNRRFTTECVADASSGRHEKC